MVQCDGDVDLQAFTEWSCAGKVWAQRSAVQVMKPLLAVRARLSCLPYPGSHPLALHCRRLSSLLSLCVPEWWRALGSRCCHVDVSGAQPDAESVHAHWVCLA